MESATLPFPTYRFRTTAAAASHPVATGIVRTPLAAVIAMNISEEVIHPFAILSPGGETTKSSGNILSPNGETTKSLENILSSDGETTKSPGNILSSDGETTKSPGNILSSGGETTKSPGNVLSPKGETAKSQFLVYI